MENEIKSHNKKKTISPFGPTDTNFEVMFIVEYFRGHQAQYWPK